MSQHKNSQTGTLRERLAQMQDLSKGESEVALWVDRHYDKLPFANVSDLAEGAGVSDMTVSRFARRLGYKNFKAFKAAAAADYRGTGPGESLKRARRIAVAKGTDSELSDQLQLELDAIIEVYALAATDTNAELQPPHAADRAEAGPLEPHARNDEVMELKRGSKDRVAGKMSFESAVRLGDVDGDSAADFPFAAAIG